MLDCRGIICVFFLKPNAQHVGCHLVVIYCISSSLSSNTSAYGLSQTGSSLLWSGMWLLRQQKYSWGLWTKDDQSVGK